MKILFTGATGVIGRTAIPHLVAGGHEVDAVARSDRDRGWLADIGARPVEVDLFDPVAVDRAVDGVEAVVHFATSIPVMSDAAKPAAWEMNDRLRSEATRHLVDAAIRHDVAVFIQESITFTYADGGDTWLTEDATIDSPSVILDSVLEAERHVAAFTAAGRRGVSLRFSHLYGPGRASAEYVAAVAKRRLPVIGKGSNYFSNLHTADAGTAVAAALTVPAGVYNVSDDDPVPAHVVTESLAEILEVPAPRHLPVWLAKLVLRSVLPVMTVSQRISADRFKEATGWDRSTSRPPTAGIRSSRYGATTIRLRRPRRAEDHTHAGVGGKWIRDCAQFGVLICAPASCE